MPRHLQEDQSSNSAFSIFLQGLSILLFIPALAAIIALLIAAVTVLVAFGLIGLVVGTATTLIQCLTCGILNINLGEMIADLGKGIFGGLAFCANCIYQAEHYLATGGNNSNLRNFNAQYGDQHSSSQDIDLEQTISMLNNINRNILSNHLNNIKNGNINNNVQPKETVVIEGERVISSDQQVLPSMQPQQPIEVEGVSNDNNVQPQAEFAN